MKMRPLQRVTNYWKRLYVVPCSRCKRTLDVAAHATTTLPNQGVWHLDTRQVIVRCPKCRSFFKAFVYPVFNRVPPARALMELALLNVATLLLIVSVASR